MTVVLLLFQTALWLAVAIAFMSSRRASVFHPFAFYLVFHGLVFVVRPIVEHLFKFDRVFYYMAFYPSDEVIQLTLVVTSFALVVYAAVHWLTDPSAPRFDRPVPDGFGADEWRAFLLLGALIGPIALYSAYSAIGTTNLGDPLIQMDRDLRTGVTVFTNTTGYFAVAQEAAGTLSLMLIWGARFRPWSFVPLLIFLAERIYLGWARWTIVLTLMMLGLLYLFRSRRRWINWHFIVAAIPLFVLFQQLGENREYFKSWVTGEPSEADPLVAGLDWIERQDTLDFANFDFLTYIVDVVPAKSGTYTYFAEFLQLFTEPIPRLLWPGKPFGAPIVLVSLNDFGNFNGLTLSVVGMGWLSGGWIGVVIMMTFVGVVTARLHRWFWSGEASSFKILTYCVFAPLTLQWYRDGDISIAKFVFVTIGPLLLWLGLLRLFRHSTALVRQS